MLVVGLGNPGSQYANTRHNIGFMVLDQLLNKNSATPLNGAPFEGELYKIQNNFFLKPQTFMNLSGRSVASVKRFYKIDEVVVVHDDLDLPFGAIRFKRGGGNGGHNGLKSTDAAIGDAYIRVRMGIGRPQYKGEVISYVLSGFTQEENPYIESWTKKAADAVLQLAEMPLEKVSSLYSVKSIEI
jgi:peptidyl-tRNA hydrolase, PTH1 family